MALIPFAEWTPDQPALGAGVTEALNVIPGARAYLPFQKYGALSVTPLDAKCQGAAAFRAPSGAIGAYAGDISKLYLQNGPAWVDASISGGYATDPAGRWTMVNFGDLALASNGVDPIQKITIDGGTTFANLGGTPPIARYLGVCKDFVVAARLATDATAVQWSATNNSEDWPIGSGGGDIQPLPDTGEVTGLACGDYFLVFCERAVHRFDFIGGDIIFQRRQIGFGIGCSLPGTVQFFNDRAFFYHGTGFYMCVQGSTPAPIGVERVNRYFAKSLASGAQNYVFSTIDPVNSLYVVGFCNNGADGFPITEMMVYKWDAGQFGEWSHVIDGNSYDCLFSGISAQNIVMEDLDVYGTMEDVPYSLDSDAWLGQGNQLFGAFGSDHNSGWFNGTPMRAVLTTTEANLNEGQVSLVRGFRPVIEASSLAGVTATTYARATQASALTTNPASQNKAPNARGLVRARIKGRYHRAKVVIDGPDWVNAQGIDDLEAYPAGQR